MWWIFSFANLLYFILINNIKKKNKRNLLLNKVEIEKYLSKKGFKG